MVAKKIRIAEVHLRDHLSALGLSTQDDLRDVSINPERLLAEDPMRVMVARRAKRTQSNLASHYSRWEKLCRHHQRAVDELESDAEDST